MKIKIQTEQEVLAKINSLIEYIKKYDLIEDIISYYDNNTIFYNTVIINNEEILKFRFNLNLIYNEDENDKGSELKIYTIINRTEKEIRIIVIQTTPTICDAIDFIIDKDSLEEIINDIKSNYILKENNNNLIEFKKE